jgi:hypothetical protein
MLVGVYCVLWWLVRGAKPLRDLPYLNMTRWETMAHCWTAGNAMAWIRMRDCYPLEDVIADLKERIKEGEKS